MEGFILSVIVINVLFLGLGNQMLPIWMFVNSLQLIVHAPLLATYVPSNLSTFLMKYLNMLRVYSQPLDDVIETW